MDACGEPMRTTWSTTSHYHTNPGVKSSEIHIHIAKVPARRTAWNHMSRSLPLSPNHAGERDVSLQSTSGFVRKWDIVRHGPITWSANWSNWYPPQKSHTTSAASARIFDNFRLPIKTQVRCMLCANQCRTCSICEEFLCHLRSVELHITSQLQMCRPCSKVSYVHIVILSHCQSFFTLFTFNST